MVIKVKIFLEKCGHLVNDLEEFFDEVYLSGLGDDEIGYLCSLLDQAGIKNINEFRDKSLHKVIDFSISEFGTSKDPEIEMIPLRDFIEAFLENNIGYSNDYVKQYIIHHADEWKNFVNIYVDDIIKIPLIARKQ